MELVALHVFAVHCVPRAIIVAMVTCCLVSQTVTLYIASFNPQFPYCMPAKRAFVHHGYWVSNGNIKKKKKNKCSLCEITRETQFSQRKETHTGHDRTEPAGKQWRVMRFQWNMMNLTQ